MGEVVEAMKVNTVRFGEIEVQEENVFVFPHGMPGFEDHKQFLILQAPDNLPFYFMQSCQDEELAFVITDPFLFYTDYAFDLPDNVQAEMGIIKPDQVQVWTIVTIDSKSGLEEACTNLLAPIIVNKANNQCRQVILHNTNYQLKHPLVFQMEDQAVVQKES